jgi:hypothetical protein
LAKIEIEKLLKEKSFNAHYYIAMAYVGINEFKPALDELEKSVKDKEIFLYYLKVDPVFFPLKNEPRFQAVLKKINL